MKKQKKLIMTPVLKYWGFQKHPFDDYILKNITLDIFVDRENELHQLYNSLSNRLTGVYGFHGVGKSTVLRKFEDILNKDNVEVIYTHLTGTTPKAVFREVLAGILQYIIEGKIRLSKHIKLDAGQEFDRVASSIRVSRGHEYSANVLVRGKIVSSEINEKAIHTEESATLLIRKIVESSMTPFVVIIDDLERIKLVMKDQHEYFQFVSSVGSTIDESFSHEGIAFALSLDSSFVDHLKNRRTADEKSSFLFGSLVHLKTFPPQILMDFMRVRLNACGWNKSFVDFMDEDTFWMLMLASNGHARRALAILRSAMEMVEMHNKPLKIDSQSLMQGIEMQEERLDAMDYAILQYLKKSGPSSISDVKFQKEIGLGKSALNERLRGLVGRICLNVKKDGVGGSSKDYYMLPEILF